jgi:tetratricopeptide (TPR) repeat protein
MPPTRLNHFDRIASIVLSVTVLLCLFAFVSKGFLPSELLKGYLLVAGVSISFLLWLAGRLVEGSFRIPRSRILSAIGIFTLAAFVSALFSPAPYLSFFGEGFDSGAFIPLLMLALMSFLASVLFSSRRSLGSVVFLFLGAYLVLALFQLVHLVVPLSTSFGTFLARAATPVGAWADFGYLSGAALIGFTLIISFFFPSRLVRMLSLTGLALALFFVVLVGDTAVYALVGFFAMGILGHKLLAARLSAHRRFPVTAFLLTLAMLFLFLTQSVFGGYLARVLNAASSEARPNFASTFVVAKGSLLAHPVVGAGPNRFAPEWAAYRPAGINLGSFWDASFPSGASFLGTVAFLGGGLGLLAGLWLVLAFLFESIRRVFRASRDAEDGSLAFSLFLLTAYFFILLLVASPGISIVACAFFFLGLLVAVLVAEKRIAVAAYSFLKEYRHGFLAILTALVFVAGSVAVLAFATEHFVSAVYFGKGVRAAAMRDLVRSDARMASAIRLTDLPRYERGRVVLAERSLAELFARTANGEGLSDADRAEARNSIERASSAALRAVIIDSGDIENHMVLGDLMRLLAPLKIENAFSAAEGAYKKAIELAPAYPKSHFNLAKLYLDANDAPSARAAVQKALDIKPNYTDAQLLLDELPQ